MNTSDTTCKMDEMTLTEAGGPLHGTLRVPGDKSISHRAVMFGSIAEGDTHIRHFLRAQDCLSTMSCFRSMGIDIEDDGAAVVVHGRGLHGLSQPQSRLDAGNSGTTTRLISGILAAQPFETTLTGDESVCRRPMNRIIDPLTRMGADITSLQGSGCAPLRIRGRNLTGIDYVSPVASAQVKSCLLLAGLYASGRTCVTEPVRSRDHTERMLRACGADLTVDGLTVQVKPASRLWACDVDVPADPSSAAYFIAAALIVPGSEVRLEDVCINPTRSGFLTACRNMGADIEETGVREVCGEQVCDLIVRSSSLHGTRIGGEIIPSLIDELPILAVLAAYADGETVISDARELRVKESDRIASMTAALSALGIQVQEHEDGMTITGGPLHGGFIDTHDDHRVAMSMAVAALGSSSPVRISHPQCIRISYPGFFEDLGLLLRS